MRKLLLLVCCTIALNLHAQITTEEQPYGLSTGFKSPHQETISLQAPDMEAIHKSDMINDQKGGPVPYAHAIYVSFTTETTGLWQEMDDGGKLWQLKVHIPGALSRGNSCCK